jgi:hypothetical protein
MELPEEPKPDPKEAQILADFYTYLDDSVHNPDSNIAYATAMTMKDFISQSTDATMTGFLQNFEKAIKYLQEKVCHRDELDVL